MSGRISMPELVATSETNQSHHFLSNKLNLALIIGTPIVLGTGVYIYYRYYHKNKSNQVNDPFKSAMNFKLKGNNLFKEGKYLDAIQCYTNAVIECPKDKAEDLSTFYQNRAASYEMINKYQQVIDDCNQAIKLNNRYTKALIRRAKANESLGRFSEALRDITTVCIIEQFQNQNNLLFTDRLLKDQSKREAKALLKTRSPKMPSHHFIRHYFMSYSTDPIVTDKDASNIEQLLKNLKAKQDNSGDTIIPEYYLLNGTIEILKGRIEEGEKDLELVINLSECDPNVKVNALIKLGTIKVQDITRPDCIDAALSYFERAIHLNETNADIYLHRAQIYLLAEKVDEARKDLEKCCQLNPHFPSALAQKLYVQFRCGIRLNDESAVKKAIEGFEEAIHRFSDSSEVLSLYAQALMEKGEHSKADKYFVKAIEKDPIDGNLYVHRGILYLQWNNDVNKAVEFLDKAKDVDPSCQFAFEMLGSIQVQRGCLIDGIKQFDKALELAQTELDCSHIYSLRNAAQAQLDASNILGIDLNN